MALKILPELQAKGHHLVLLDGGIGSEIRRRGVKLHSSAWSAVANLENPNEIINIHKDYILAGANIITANSFSASLHNLKHAGLGDKFSNINQTAVDLVKRAIEETNSPDIKIAGSISPIPPMDSPHDLYTKDDTYDNYLRQADILANAGADLLICEMLLETKSAKILVDACSEIGLPLWLGFSAGELSADGKISAFRASGKYLNVPIESLEQVVTNVLNDNVEAIGIMHTKTHLIPASLEVLKDIWDGALMAYAETGKSGDSDWHFEDIISPENYSDLIKNWVHRFQLEIVGGCCGTSPEHISVLRKALNSCS